MPLAISWRWKAPVIETPKSNFEKAGWGQAMSDTADAIKYAREMRYKKEQDKRRNDIEDEKNRRLWEAEDAKNKANKEAAELIAQKKSQRDALVAQRAQIQQQLDMLKAKLNG